MVYFSEPEGRKGTVANYHENNLPLSLVSRSTGCLLSGGICSEPALDGAGVQHGHVLSPITLGSAFSSLILTLGGAGQTGFWCFIFPGPVRLSRDYQGSLSNWLGGQCGVTGKH